MPGFHIGTSDAERWAPPSTLDVARSYRWRIQRINFSLPGTHVVIPRIWPLKAPVELPIQIPLSLDCTYIDVLKSYVSVDLPSLQFNKTEILGLSTRYKFPKSITFPPITITFYDTHAKLGGNNISVYKFIEQLVNVLWTPKHGITSAYGNNKGKIVLNELDHKGKPLNELTIYQAWPANIKHSQLNMASNELKTISITFEYDYYTYK